MRPLLLFLPALLFGNSLTIYNNNLAAIKEIKEINLKQGKQEVSFNNLPNLIIADSIIVNFNKASLHWQSFIRNPLNLDKILHVNLGSEVAFFTKDKKRQKGKLISINPIIIKSNNQYFFTSAQDIIFSKLPQNSFNKAMLLCKVSAKEAGKEKVNLFYLMHKISWRANYILLLKQKTLTFQAFAKVQNLSKKDFKNYKLSLIAGDVNKKRSEFEIQRSYAKAMPLSAVNIKTKEIHGLYEYKIPFQINLHAKETKQFSLFKATNIPYKEYAIASNSLFNNYGEQKLIFAHYIEFQNKNSLNYPLPRGVARIYQDDKFLGEDIIKNTPPNRKITLQIGNYFTISGTKKITKFISRSHYKNVQTTYRIKNSSNKSTTVKIKENIPRYGEKITFKSSCKSECKLKKENAFLHVYTITLKPKSTFIFNSEFEIYY